MEINWLLRIKIMMSSNCLPKREIRGATWVYINGLQLQLKKLEVLLIGGAVGRGEK